METLAPTPATAETTDVSTPEVDTEGSQTPGDGSAPSAIEAGTPKPKDPVQERFDKLTRDKYDALREADRRGYELERLNARLAELEKAPKPEIATQNDFPTLEQYGYDEGKYQAAVAAHYTKIATEQGTAAAREALRAEREAEQQRKAGETWAQKEAELIKTKPDYVDKVKNAATLPISEQIQKALQAHELGPQIALHMVENADASRAIMRMPIEQQLMEVGRIAAKLELAKLPPKPPVSQAPPPVGKVETDDAAVTIKVDSADADSLSDKEWTRRRNAQEQARLKKLRG